MQVFAVKRLGLPAAGYGYTDTDTKVLQNAHKN